MFFGKLKQLFVKTFWFLEKRRPGGYTLTSRERAYAGFQIVSFLGKEVLAHDVYTKDELRTYRVVHKDLSISSGQIFG